MSSSVRRRDLVWAAALVALLSVAWVARSDSADAGVAEGDGIAVVYVAVGTNYPDALGVGPGAGADAAPIIILPTNPPIPGPSSVELVRLDPRTVIIIGGPAAISAAMETALGALLPNATITRISGADRYATNAAFSAATFPIEGWAAISAPAFTAALPATDSAFMTLHAYNGSSGILYSTIQLPHGAEILELKAGVFDADVAGGTYVSLYAIDDGGGSLLIADASSSFPFTGGATTLSDTTIEPGTEIVNNEIYAYTVFVTGVVNSDLRVLNVRVRYRLGTSNG